MHEHYGEYDVVMACPHLSYKIADYIEKYGNQVPIYVIPAMMYGTMNVKEVYQDALDIYEGYKKTHKNLQVKYFQRFLATFVQVFSTLFDTENQKKTA